MNNLPFNDEISLAEHAETLGRQALKSGLIPSFVVHHFPDSWEFYIPNEQNSAALSPEEAYLKFKQLLDRQS